MDAVFAKQISKFVPCDSRYSFFFDLIRKERLPAPNNPLHRFCSLMRKFRASGYFREELQHNREIYDEVTDVSIRVGRKVDGDAIRFTFFRCREPHENLGDFAPHSILGYLVLLKLHIDGRAVLSFVLEAVVREPSVLIVMDGQPDWHPITNHYFHCHRRFNTVVGTKTSHARFIIPGAFFCQQSSFTHVCGHAALRAAWNSTPYLYDKLKLTNRKINILLGIDHRKNTFGKAESSGVINGGTRRGLETSEIKAVIEEFGGQHVSATFLDESGLEYERFVYPLLESGWPVILGVYCSGSGHVVTLLGHTLNSDRWMPEARRGYGEASLAPHYSAVEWTDHFIAQDDNYGMYVTIPTEALKSVLSHRHNPYLHPGLALAITPRGVKLSGLLAEASAVAAIQRLFKEVYVGRKGRWMRKLCEGYVCRTLLQTKKAYIDHILPFLGPHSEQVTFLRQILPFRFWVTELTVPNLYSANKHKLGDVLVRCDNCQERERVIFTWLPKNAYWDAPYTWPIRDHIPLLRNGSAPRTFEW